MPSRRWVCLLLALGALSTSFAAEKIRVHFISGSKEYRSEESLKAFIPWLETNYHMTTTVSWGRDGVQELDGLDRPDRAA